MSYQDFLSRKQIVTVPSGFETGELNPEMFSFESDITRWALRLGKAALFEGCGLGKTFQQLEWAVKVTNHTDLPVIILAPLAALNLRRAETIAEQDSLFAQIA